MPKLIFLIILLLPMSKILVAQETGAIMWYNVENLFDTIHQEGKRDVDFTPQGKHVWNTPKYYHKLNNLSKVILNAVPYSIPDLIGLCEIENAEVLQSLIKRPGLEKCNFSIVHYESPDERGIDVALIYNPKTVKVLRSNPIPIDLKNDFTRDILHVQVLFMKDTLDLYLNHWPSRSGGELQSRHKRIAAAEILFREIINDRPKNFLILGDFNDEFEDISLNTLADSLAHHDLGIQNNWDHYSIDQGSHHFSGRWSKIDQIHSHFKSYRVQSFEVMSRNWLLTPKGQPWRTYQGPRYIGGFSDHLPLILDIEN